MILYGFRPPLLRLGGHAQPCAPWEETPEAVQQDEAAERDGLAACLIGPWAA
ncbi:hypothetical protein ABZT47_37645 [Sphaerisporangium sp. NPDC005289]|uniref:Uncharacterized protein n=2 Tax=Sphaerisporangium TaxID=321315 RepID=A0ABW2PD83_9ACTN